MREKVILLLVQLAMITTAHAHEVRSPDGKWIAIVKKSDFTVPSNCFFASAKGSHAYEIWLINTGNMKKKLLVSPQFDCREVTKVILDPNNLQFSTDSKTLYFETSAWVTSGAIHAVDTNGKNLRFISDGSEFQIMQNGSYKGDLIVNKHRYRFIGDTPQGSYNEDWLLTPTGKEIKIYKRAG